MVQLSKIIDENRDRKVTLEEWNNWVHQRKKMGRDERFLNDYPDYLAWEKFFFELSKGSVTSVVEFYRRESTGSRF